MTILTYAAPDFDPIDEDAHTDFMNAVRWLLNLNEEEEED